MHKRFLYPVACLIFAPLLLGSPPGQQQAKQEIVKKPSKHSGLQVVTEFGVAPTESAQDQQRRRTREKRYGDILKIPLSDPGLFEDGKTETSKITFIDYVALNNPDPGGLPITSTAPIIIGTVLSGKCLINQARTYVYTDYQVRVDHVLKPNPKRELKVGDVVVGSREGGAVHFPSGHVTNLIFAGHGLPNVGSQYVLFLFEAVPNSPVPEYEIAIDSGHELKNGQAYALDDATTQYDGMDAKALLETIQKAISAKG